MSNPRKEFGDAVRDARELRAEGKWTQVQLAREVRTSAATISRIERGEGPIPGNLPALFDQIFNTDGLFKDLYDKTLADGFPAYSRRRMEVEQLALSISEWTPTVIPGLLQTQAYARALFRAGDSRASDREIASKVGSRMARKDVLRAPSPPYFSAVICESVLRRDVGGSEVMREQLSALLTFGSQHTNVLQVLPLSAGTHGLMDGSMSILTKPDGASMVYTESIGSAVIIDEPSAVQHLTRAYDVLTASALAPGASAQMIVGLMEAL